MLGGFLVETTQTNKQNVGLVMNKTKKLTGFRGGVFDIARFSNAKILIFIYFTSLPKQGIVHIMFLT